MKKKTVTGIALAGMGLLANGATAAGSYEIRQEGPSPAPGAVIGADSLGLEASFLEVPGTCKARFASFGAVSVGLERVADAVLAIHDGIDRVPGAVA